MNILGPVHNIAVYLNEVMLAVKTKLSERLFQEISGDLALNFKLCSLHTWWNLIMCGVSYRLKSQTHPEEKKFPGSLIKDRNLNSSLETSCCVPHLKVSPKISVESINSNGRTDFTVKFLQEYPIQSSM